MLMRGYSEEIKWRDEHYVPKTINEHLELSRTTNGSFHLVISSFVGMGDNRTKEIPDWLLTYPELMKSFTTLCRLSNDIASTKVSITTFLVLGPLSVYLHLLHGYIILLKLKLFKHEIFSFH
jgi:hypothetical protein